MEWRIIKDFPNYKVNNEGQIKSLNYNHTNREQLLKQFIGSKGYPYVILVNQGSISKCCNGLRVSARLYKWSYE